MAWFLTEYEPFPVEPVRLPEDSSVGKYSAYIWAADWKDAGRVASRRRIGEMVVGLTARKAKNAPYERPSALLKARMTARQKVEFLHGVCFLSFLAQRALGASAFDILGDKGLMHEAIHAMQNGKPSRADMRASLAAIERKVPGYWPGMGA